MRRLVILSTIVLGLAACGSTHSSTTQSALATATTNQSTTATVSTSTSATTTTATHTKAKGKPKPRTTTTRTSTSHTTSTPHSTTTSTTHTTSAPKPKPVTYTRPIQATLVGENHHPIANKGWTYTVTAHDANGNPLPGMLDIEFTFNGTVVGHDIPPTEHLRNGSWHEILTFPPAAVGQPIALQVVLHTPIGTKTLVWPVVVRKS
jgi:hypothetical protein